MKPTTTDTIDTIIEWLRDHAIGLIITLAVSIAIIVATILVTTAQSNFTENTTWKCKIQQGEYYKKVTTEGEVDSISLSEWALLDLPICD